MIAIKLIRQGRKKLGSKYIFEHMRYDFTFRSENDPFKINNNFAPMYARKFILENPQYGHLFSFKPLKGTIVL